MLPEIRATIHAIRAVRDPRFLATERGYQGAFYCALRSKLDKSGCLTKDRILEMEYQKSTRHGISQRPDIVFHIPAEISGKSVHENNYAVWAFKRNASIADAQEDFDKLDIMCCTLKYPVAIFVNIASNKTRLNLYKGRFEDRIHSFAAPPIQGSVIYHSLFENGSVKTIKTLL